MDFAEFVIAQKYMERSSAGDGGESGGGIPVVEITTGLTLGEAPLSETENAALSEMAGRGMPFFVKFQLGEPKITAIASPVEIEGVVKAFLVNIPESLGMTFTFSAGEDGRWSIVSEPVA